MYVINNLSAQVAGTSPADKPLCMKNVDPCNSMVLLDTDEEEVMQMINCLGADCATGIDGISSIVLKQYKKVKTFYNFLLKPITFLLNLCMSFGLYSQHIKRALVHHIHMCGIVLLTLVLPAMSKILKKIVNIHIKTYLEVFFSSSI